MTIGGTTTNGQLTRNCYKITSVGVQLQTIAPFEGRSVSVTNSTFDTVFVFNGYKCYLYRAGTWSEDAL